MSQYLNKAEFNDGFLSSLQEEFPHDYWDWKITVMFYIAIHCLQGVAEIQGDHLGSNHADVWDSLRNRKEKLNIPSSIVRDYGKLFNYSISSRYDGFTTQENFERIQKMNHDDSLVYLNKIKSFVRGKCKELKVAHSYMV